MHRVARQSTPDWCVQGVALLPHPAAALYLLVVWWLARVGGTLFADPISCRSWTFVFRFVLHQTCWKPRHGNCLPVDAPFVQSQISGHVKRLHRVDMKQGRMSRA
jgi:hypothetical protein